MQTLVEVIEKVYLVQVNERVLLVADSEVNALKYEACACNYMGLFSAPEVGGVYVFLQETHGEEACGVAGKDAAVLYADAARGQ
jgi:hypothetical protein